MTIQAVSLVNLTKSFKKQEALSLINLDFAENCFFAIMGPSGCGKSTLLNLIAGLETCTTGTIQVFNTDITKLSAQKKDDFRLNNIAFIFQFFNLLPTLNVLENVCLSAFEQKKRPYDKIVAEAKSLLDRLGLSKQFHKYPTELSGGMQARVGFARALIAKPRLILADEPTGSLDSATGKILLQELSVYQKLSNCTIIMVTHDHTAAQYADKILHMRDGKFV